jgi:hypothetical protein
LVREGARVIVNGVTQDSVDRVVADLWWRRYQERVLARILIARDRDQLRQIIRERDANYGTWGCKFPLLCDVLAPADVALFTNPHIVGRSAIRSRWRCAGPSRAISNQCRRYAARWVRSPRWRRLSIISIARHFC